MKFGYLIMYVEDVAATLAFYQQAFGFERKLLVPDEYGELDTGSTRLAFAARSQVKTLFAIPFQQGGLSAEAAKAYVTNLTRTGRYQRDVY